MEMPQKLVKGVFLALHNNLTLELMSENSSSSLSLGPRRSEGIIMDEQQQQQNSSGSSNNQQGFTIGPSFDNNSTGFIVWPGGLYPEEREELPLYLRITALLFLFVIFAVGTVGNTMVIIVINCSRDMRTSTNIFLVNLSVADLLVLVICTPTCIMEVWYDPHIWLLGEAMCKLVPLLEFIVAHGSVLTILAISFERYYAICCPLRANYVCTKTRAVSICLTAWLAAGLITSPMYWMINFNMDPGGKANCDVAAGTLLPDIYTISTMVLFFILPLVILIVTYGLIARNLTAESCRLSQSYTRQTHRARQQVVLMLGTVVFTFFLCLLPFRILTFYVVLSDSATIFSNMELYYNLLYFCRILLYINSALNPILYNIMSSKFRNGFLTLCTRGRNKRRFTRRDTFHTMTTTSSAASTASSLSTTTFLHPTNGALATTALACSSRNGSERRRQQQQQQQLLGLGIYGQCCRCQCHDYVTHAVDEGAGGSSSSGSSNSRSCSPTSFSLLPKSSRHHKIRKKSKNFNNYGSGGCYAHWYCRKCREGPTWDAKYLAGSPSTGLSNTVILNQVPNHHYQTYHGGKSPGEVTTTTTALIPAGAHGRAFRGGSNNYERCFGSNNCQFCKRQQQGLAILHEDHRKFKGIGSKGNNKCKKKGKMTIKMALKNNYYSCSFASFSNTNTLETIL